MLTGDSTVSVRDTIFNLHMRASNSLVREERRRESSSGGGGVGSAVGNSAGMDILGSSVYLDYIAYDTFDD